MNFTFTDALILHAIHFSEMPGTGAELSKIISYADYINHAVISFSELEETLTKLITIGVIEQKGLTLKTTARYLTWWDKQYPERKSTYVSAIIDRIEIYLNETFWDFQLPVQKPEILISESEFTAAIENYLNR